MAEEIEDGAVVEDPLQGQPQDLEKPFEFPPACAKSGNVANGTHGNFDQSAGIHEGLSLPLRLHDPVEYLRIRFAARPAIGVGGILAADPGEAQILEHLSHIRAVGEAVGEAARRAEAGRVDADARLEGGATEPDVLADDLVGLLPLDQPGGAVEAILDVAGARRPDVDVVVGVIADRVARPHDLLEPVHVGLLEHLPDREAMQAAAVRLDAAGRLDRVLLRLGVQVPLLVVPAGRLPGGEIPGHLQIQGDGDKGLPAVLRRLFLPRGQVRAGGEAGATGQKFPT